MEGNPRLEATTHVVAHLLRELNAALRDVLRPMVPDEAWPTEGQNVQAIQIGAICDALGVAAEDQLRALWRDFAQPLARWAHRYSRAAPRPVDEDFRQLWDQAQAVVFELARRIEANYTRALGLVDELGAGAPDVSRLRQEVPHSTVVLDRFFGRAGLAWFEPLREAGYFHSPPALEYEDDGSVGYARWPQGRFLARVAPEAPDAVIGIALQLATDNPEAQETVVEAGLAMAPDQAARLVPKVQEWLETPAQWALPYRVEALVGHLVSGGCIEEGIELLRSLLRSENARRNQGGMGAYVLEQLTPTLFPEAGITGVELYAELLADAVAEETPGAQDYSSLWRPHLGGGRRGDLRDALVSALRDAGSAVVEHRRELLPEVIGAIESRETSIFKRIALDLLLRHPDSELIAEHLTNPELLLDPNAIREYDELAQAHFEELGEEGKALIRSAIEDGPAVSADDPDYLGRWRLQMLTRFPPPRPDDWESEISELTGQYGEPDREAEPLPRAGFIGPTSPLSQQEIAEMPVADFVEFARAWEPPSDDWQAPSREGLGRVLRQAVVEDPVRFAEEAAGFADLDPTYVRALFSGLREALVNERCFPWPSVISLAVAVIERPREIEGRDPRGLGAGDPGWVWTWQDLGHLIAAGLGRREGGIPHDERDRVWTVIAFLAEDPNPSAADEEREDGLQQAAMLALNSVRGAAMDAAMSYIWWVVADLEQAERRLPEEARVLLERRLDPATELTLAIHSTFGKWLPYLSTADSGWTESHLRQIFPVEDESRRRVALLSYFAHNGVWERTFRMLTSEYLYGIEQFATSESQTGQFQGDPGESLVDHLMTAFRYDLVGLGDHPGLLARFYEVATLERRADAIESLGRGLMGDEELTEDMATRLQAFWERRLQAVVDSDDDAATEELRGFAWWFASRKLDESWSLAQLEALLVAGGRLDPDHVVAERLLVLGAEHLSDVLRCLELLIESGTRPWFVFGAREEIETMLAAGLAAGGGSAEKSRDIINRLVARGHVDYQRLLDQ